MKSDAKDERLAEWVKTWQSAGAELEKIRREKIRNEKTAQSILAFADASRSALAGNRPRNTSGLIEMQEWFKLLRRADDTDN